MRKIYKKYERQYLDEVIKSMKERKYDAALEGKRYTSTRVHSGCQ